MKFLARAPRTAVAAVVLTAAAAGLAGVAAAFTADQPATRPASQVVEDQVIRQADPVDTTEPTSAAPTTTEQTPAPVDTTTAQAPVPVDEPAAVPGAPADDPQSPSADPVATTTSQETAPPPPPTQRCWMDDSDPVTYPNGREICEPIS